MTTESKQYQERERGIRRGKYVGFETLDDFYQFKQGYPLVIYGLPYSGKSEFWFEILLNLSTLYDKQHFLFTPESGTKSEILNLLIAKHIGKPVHKLYDEGKENLYAMSDDEFETGKAWVNRYFRVVDYDEFLDHEHITLQDVYDLADALTIEEGWSFDTITIDPWAELHLELEEANRREDLYISKMITLMREDGQRNARTTCIINHIRDTKPMYDKNTGQAYFRPPVPTEITGGQMWFRRGFTMICVFRPNTEVYVDEHSNASWIIVQKVKPRGSGKTGICKLYYDLKKEGRYYEIINQQEYYARPKA